MMAPRPPTAATVAAVWSPVLGIAEPLFLLPQPSMSSIEGVLAFVGTRNPKIGATYAQHSCFYKIDETVLAKGSMVAAQYAIDFLAEPTQEELDGPTIAAVAETNPDLAAKLRSAKATAAEARDAMHDARTARHAAIKGIHDARAAARHEEKRDE